MSRVHFWSFLLNEEGQPVQGADVSVYLAGTVTAAYVYTSESGATQTNSSPQCSTDATGYFEFWIGDTAETYGYTTSQKFKIYWSKTGVSTGFIDNVDILPAGANFISETISSWTTSGADDYADVTHSLGTLYPLVQLYDSSDELLSPSKIEGISTTTTRVWVPSGSGNVNASFVG